MAKNETAMPQMSSMPVAEKPRMGGKMMTSLLVLALILVVGLAGYLYWQNVQLKKNPQAVAQEQVKSLVAKVGKLILLPTDETPTIATVTDPNLLKSQEFFSKAQTGDQVLIYTNAKEAILYRPSSNMIINVAPVNIGNTTPAATTPSATTKPSTTTPKP